MKLNLTALCITILSFTALIYPSYAAYAIANKGIKLAPHRAIYEMSLDDLRSGTSVASLQGRLVFEISGSSCDGYTINMRFVTRITDVQGSEKITDLRASSWEQGLGERFRFNSSHYLNQRLDQVTSGDAKRLKNNGPVKIKIDRPKESKLELSSDVLFPTQHIINIIEAAQQKKGHLHADVYDGSEQGLKVYATTTIIGREFKPVENKTLSQIENSAKLHKLASWPVAISYFNKDSKASTPAYQIGFRLFANGVSRKLLIDYGDFSIKGVLKEIEFYQEAKCEKK